VRSREMLRECSGPSWIGGAVRDELSVEKDATSSSSSSRCSSVSWASGIGCGRIALPWPGLRMVRQRAEDAVGETAAGAAKVAAGDGTREFVGEGAGEVVLCESREPDGDCEDGCAGFKRASSKRSLRAAGSSAGAGGGTGPGDDMAAGGMDGMDGHSVWWPPVLG
jgi:hypothetical protein